MVRWKWTKVSGTIGGITLTDGNGWSSQADPGYAIHLACPLTGRQKFQFMANTTSLLDRGTSFSNG